MAGIVCHCREGQVGIVVGVVPDGAAIERHIGIDRDAVGIGIGRLDHIGEYQRCRAAAAHIGRIPRGAADIESYLRRVRDAYYVVECHRHLNRVTDDIGVVGTRI